MKRFNGFLAAVLPLALAAGCGDANDNEDTSTSDGTTGGMTSGSPTGPSTTGSPTSADTGMMTTTDTADTGDTTGTPAGCADPSDPAAPRVEVSENISGDEMWTCDNIYVLSSIIFVNGGTLSIEAGTTVQGMGGSALVIDQDASIDAQGAADAPIVMTSILPEGDRNRGDWGGLVLLGDAPINLEGGVGSAEGFENPPSYGGDDDAHNCGTLSYVRVEWAGYEISMGNELNGITFYACGTATTVDHVQSHMGKDDGIEFFGGNVDAKYVVITGAADDSLDCDQGFQGRLQHVLIHQDPVVGDNAFEWSNQGTDFTATPLTGPTVANATIIGSGAGGDKSKGMTLKEGTEAFIYSSIITNITNETVLLTHQETQDSAQGGGIELEGLVLGGTPTFGVDDGTAWTASDLETWIMTGAVTVADPMLPSIDWGSPDVAVATGTPAEGAGATPSNGYFDETTYAGAVEPGGTDWTQESWINYAF